MRSLYAKHKNQARGILALGAVAAAMYALRVPCLFRVAFGIPCPGCGLTRAWASALRLGFAEAFRWHPLFFLAPLIFLLMTDIFKSHGRLRTGLLIAVCLAFIIVYVYRMAVYFPHTEPMIPYDNSLFTKII